MDADEQREAADDGEQVSAENAVENSNVATLAVDGENAGVYQMLRIEPPAEDEVIAVEPEDNLLMENIDDDHIVIDEIDDDNDLEDDDDEDLTENDIRDGLSNPEAGPPRWFIPADQVRAAIREIVAQGQRGEFSIDYMMNRDNFMQRLRRVIFSMDHMRQRNRARITNSENDAEGGDAAGDQQNMDTENETENSNETAAIENNTENDVVVEEEPENPIRFDTNLPAEHSYLGNNMNRVSGVNYLDVGQSYNMMLFMHQHILFPGEILPFMIPGSIIDADIDAQNGLLFGVCFPFLSGNEQEETIYGVTCQIYEKGTDARGNTLVKSRALQRFITKGSEFTCPLQFIAAHPQLKCYGFVKILPEIFLPEPLKCIDMGSMNRFRDNVTMQQTFKRFQAATTPWPAHMYDYYSITTIVEKARTQLAQHKIDTMPTDPIQLSFWLVRNLYLSESMMKTIFMTDSVNLRMKMISSTFKEEAVFTCRYCGNRIANCRELFAMSKHGVQTQYCNSSGYIHQTNTVYQLLRDAVSFSGEPSTEFSWFPGYQWHIVICKLCSRHIGWQFKAVEPNLVPKSFFGISSSSVRVSESAHLPSNPGDVIYRRLLRLANQQIQ